LGFEKSQRSVTHDSLRYINILTYLLMLIKVKRPHKLYTKILQHKIIEK